MNQAWSPGTDVFLARGSSAQDVERSLPEHGERDDASRRDVGTGTGTGAATHRRRPRVLRELPMPDTYRGVYCVRFNADGSLLASTYGSGAIQLRNPDTGELRATLRGPLEHAPPVMCARFHPILMDSFYAGGACGNVFQCSVKGSLRRFATEPKNEVNALDLNVAGDVLATGGKDATIRLYDPETAAVGLPAADGRASLAPGDPRAGEDAQLPPDAHLRGALPPPEPGPLPLRRLGRRRQGMGSARSRRLRPGYYGSTRLRRCSGCDGDDGDDGLVVGERQPAAVGPALDAAAGDGGAREPAARAQRRVPVRRAVLLRRPLRRHHRLRRQRPARRRDHQRQAEEGAGQLPRAEGGAGGGQPRQ